MNNRQYILRCLLLASSAGILFLAGCTTTQETPLEPIPQVIKARPAVKKTTPRKRPQTQAAPQNPAPKERKPASSINDAGRYVPIPAGE
ncbi:MAG: hypothetical protein Q4G42_02365 [Neisseria sp.]|nr:hypothetical protein [Neisseria sp.]